MVHSALAPKARALATSLCCVSRAAVIQAGPVSLLNLISHMKNEGVEARTKPVS